MPTIGPMIAASAKLCLGYTERLLKDVTQANFARFANVHGQVIESNHPAFVLGHLSIYSPRIIEQLGADAKAYEPSEAFLKVFSKDAICVDDPEGSIYPAMDEVVERYFTGYRRAIEVLEGASDEIFSRPNPNEVMRSKFATIGAMHGFYVGGHIMMHLGQVSAWRRCAGLGAA